MPLLTGLLLGCSGGVFAAAYNRRRVELVMPAAMMCNALLLYFSFLLGVARIGVWVIAGGNLLLLGAGLLRARRNWEEFRRDFFTPGLAAFFLWSLAAYIISRYRCFCAWDEFSHWGSVAKAVYLRDQLSYAYGQTLEYAYYPPIMSVWQYFFCTFDCGFSEPTVIFASNQLLLAFLTLPLLRTNWKNWRDSVWYVVLIVIMPCGFIREFYTVYVDGALAMVMGYALCVILLYRRLNWVRMWYLLVALGFLALIKDSGKGLGMMVLMLALVQLLCDREGRREWRSYVRIVVPAIVLLLIAYSWKYLIELYQCAKVFSSAKINIGAIFGVFFKGEPEFAFQVVKRWLLTFFVGGIQGGAEYIMLLKKSFIAGTLGVTDGVIFLLRLRPGIFPVMALMSWGLFYLRQRCNVDSVRKNLLLAAIGLPVTGTVFAFTLLIYYIFSFTEVEALRLASFERYIGMMLLAFYLTVLALGVWAVPVKRSKPRRQCRKALLLLLLLPLLFPWEICCGVANVFPGKIELLRQGVDIVQQQAKPYIRDGESVVLLDQGSYGELSWHLQYEQYPSFNMKLPCSVRMNEDDVAAFGRRNYYATVISPQEYHRQLLQHDLIICKNVDDYFRRNYGGIFVDPLLNGRVYRRKNGKFYLLPLKDVVLDFDRFNYMTYLGWKGYFSHRDGKLRCNISKGIAGMRLHELISIADGTFFRRMIITVKVTGATPYCALFNGEDRLITYFKLPPGEYKKVIELPPMVLGRFKLELFTLQGNAVVEIDKIVLSGEWSQKSKNGQHKQ